MPKGTHLNTWNPGRKSMSHYILSSQMGGNVIMSALLSLRWKLHYREGIDLRFGGYVFSRNNKKTQSFIFELNSYWHASSFKWIPFSFSVQMLDNCNVSTAGSWVCLFFFLPVDAKTRFLLIYLTWLQISVITLHWHVCVIILSPMAHILKFHVCVRWLFSSIYHAEKHAYSTPSALSNAHSLPFKSISECHFSLSPQALSW